MATADDAATIVAMIRGLADYEHELGAVQATPAIIAAQMRSAEPPFECLLAEEDGQSARLRAVLPRLFDLARGAGAVSRRPVRHCRKRADMASAGALMRRLAAITLERGWKRIEWLVLDWNTPAQGFYAEHGAGHMKRWQVWGVDGEKLTRLADGIQP